MREFLFPLAETGNKEYNEGMEFRWPLQLEAVSGCSFQSEEASMAKDPFSTWYDSLIQDYLDGIRLEEASLQLDLVGDENPLRTERRIQKFGASARVFLTQVKWLIQLARFNPLIHWWTSLLLRQFVSNFLRLERKLAQQGKMSYVAWCELHKDGLAKILAANDRRFNEVIVFRQLPAPVQVQVVQGLAREIGQPNATETPPQQMS